MLVEDLTTPALVVDGSALERNLATMANALGPRLRPHVKAHKCTSLARRQLRAGSKAFTCATIREVEGLAGAGLGEDLLLANEVLDGRRLAALDARVTVAVDSEETIEAAAEAGIREVVIDVDVGLPRCGCVPEDAGRLADVARAKHLAVRGVMGYEGHAVGIPDRGLRTELTAGAMEILLAAHEQVGGELISAGATGNYDINTWVTEIQAGSYALMDTTYAKLHLPFEQAVAVLATVISVSAKGHAVLNCGLKALGMDHGDPDLEGRHDPLIVSDEHITFLPVGAVKVGDLIKVFPAHVDPTVAYHERLHVLDDGHVIETWEVDLRGW